MITYYIGNVRDKRLFFRQKRMDAALADNCDVIADFKLNGKVCFVLDDLPYANMRVGEYLGYARAIETRLPLSDSGAKELVKKAGLKIPTKKKIGSLDRISFRFLMLAASLTDAKKEAYINLDGIIYSRRNRRKIRAIMKRTARNFGNLHIAVSDYRFIPRKASVMAAANGVMVQGKTKSASHYIGRLKFGIKKLKRCASLAALNGKRAVVCDN